MREINAEVKSEAVPMIPEEVLKYFLPNRPSKRKLARGSRGISISKKLFSMSSL